MPPKVENLFTGLKPPATGECFDPLLRYRNLRIERILSSATPEEAWFDQPQDEWVILLEGEATLEVAGTEVFLTPGDYLFLPAHTRHRLVRAHPAPRCLWLAVHLDPEAASA